MAVVLVQNTSDGMVNYAEDSKMLVDIPSLMTNVINYQLLLNLVDVCLYNCTNMSFIRPQMENL